MDDKNNLTVQFIEATDYLKSMKGLKHYQIAKLLNLERPKYDQIRSGRRKPSLMEINILTEKYDELSSFFKIDQDNQVKKNIGKDDELLKSLKDIIKAKDEIIKLKDEKIINLETDLQATHEAHADTLKRLYSNEEVKEEIQKRLIELEELQKRNDKN